MASVLGWPLRRQGAWPLAAALISLLIPVAAAAEIRSGETVEVGKGETVAEDLYAFGRTVRISGTVKGDLVAFASTIVIDGTVEGEVIAGASELVISGKVGESLRVATGAAVLDGSIGEDAVLATGRLRLGPTGAVGRDLLAAAGNVDLLGPVQGAIHLSAGQVLLGGAVGGDVHARTNNLKLADTAHVGGNLYYQSEREALRAPGASVAGTVERSEPVERHKRSAFLFAVKWARAVIGLFALGLAMVLLFPAFTRRAMGTLRQSPWESFGAGIAVLLGAPFAAALIFLAGVVVGGWWLGFFLLGVYALALALCIPVVGLFLGDWLMHRFGKTTGIPLALALLFGVALLTLVARVPILGALVLLVTVLFGLGAMALTGARMRRAAPAAA